MVWVWGAVFSGADAILLVKLANGSHMYLLIPKNDMWNKNHMIWKKLINISKLLKELKVSFANTSEPVLYNNCFILNWWIENGDHEEVFSRGSGAD
jgi:hypothetical protein